MEQPDQEDLDNMLLTLAKAVHPAYALLSSKISWREVQHVAQSSCILTSCVNQPGFFVGHEFLMGEATVAKHPEIFMKPEDEVQVLNIDQFRADSIDQAISLMMSLAWSGRSERCVIRSVDPDTMSIINKECSECFGGTPWNGAQLASVLTYNIAAMRSSDYPSPRVVSLESFYGKILSLFHEKAVKSWPMLGKLMLCVPFACNTEAKPHVSAEAPSERKVQRLLKSFQRPMGWSLVLNLPTSEDANADDLIVMLEEAATHCGKGRKRKMQRVARYLREMQATKDDVWRIQLTVKNLGSSQVKDYRNHTDKLEVLEGMLQCAMQRIKTDITIANMATYRNPAKHPLATMLATLCDAEERVDPAMSVANQCDVFVDELRTVAQVVLDLRRIGQWKSDWQNAVARYWTTLRNKHAILRDKVQAYQSSLPQACLARFPSAVPPIQYDLALDLFPQAAAFAFTYGRNGGFGLEECYPMSAQWLKYDSNETERLFFRAVMLKPADYGSDWMDSMQQIPESIRQLVRSHFENFVDQLDVWLESEEGRNSTAAFHARNLVQTQLDQLPSFLRKRAIDVRFVSAVALFMAVMKDLAINVITSGHYVDVASLQ